jgi:hypothetical protein
MLLSIPPEIRGMITIFVLQSHTGFVTIPLSPLSSSKILEVSPDITDLYCGTRLRDNGAISLSVLLVCRRLHEECKELLWKRNTFFLVPENMLETGCFPLRAQLQVRHVRMELDILDGAGWEGDETVAPGERLRLWVQDVALKRLVVWAQEGCLKSVTICLRGSDSSMFVSWASVARKSFAMHLEILRQAGGQMGALERKIVLEGKDMVGFSKWVTRIGERDEVLRLIGQAFNADVWAGGKLLG